MSRLVDDVLGRAVLPLGRRLEHGAGLELLGVRVEVDDGDARRDRAVQVVVLVESRPSPRPSGRRRRVEMSGSWIMELEADFHGTAPYPTARTIAERTISIGR